MAPLPVPMSTATPPGAPAVSRSTWSTSSSVSGRGMSTRGSTDSVRWRKAAVPTAYASGMPRASRASAARNTRDIVHTEHFAASRRARERGRGPVEHGRHEVARLEGDRGVGSGRTGERARHVTEQRHQCGGQRLRHARRRSSASASASASTKGVELAVHHADRCRTA